MAAGALDLINLLRGDREQPPPHHSSKHSSVASCSLRRFPDFITQQRACDKLPAVGKFETVLILQLCPSLPCLARQQNEGGSQRPLKRPYMAIRMSRN